ncbi:DUF6923 family protein [Corynebacterium diphtheriae]|uniref:DUF6923 family protein n=1 Tax=Corynebacterium diphtheriae TaxID=1717 RepID=UPI0013C5A70A|nr:Ig-like domain repeat protein [Corynebacterium diphtheriae]CAB0580035.1 cell surface protein [Corynebacterium diphtheriae]CAB0628173.1 cell surface protein [Corynebacterium diphtheriae]CAB0719252.1 cell surface protein [Corynebacterium diphtheriae]
MMAKNTLNAAVIQSRYSRLFRFALAITASTSLLVGSTLFTIQNADAVSFAESEADAETTSSSTSRYETEITLNVENSPLRVNEKAVVTAKVTTESGVTPTGSVQLNFGSEQQKDALLIDGVATYSFTPEHEGPMELYATFVSDDESRFANSESSHNKINVLSKQQVSATIQLKAPTEATVATPFEIQAIVPADKTFGEIEFSSNKGDKVTAAIDSGVAKAMITAPTEGELILEATFKSFLKTSTPELKSQPATVNIVTAKSAPSAAKLPEVSPTPDLVQIGFGDSKANLAGETLTISTSKKSEGKVKEIHVTSVVPGFANPESWSLKIDGKPVPFNEYEKRLDDNDVYFTFKDAKDYPQETRFEASGSWLGASWTSGAMELWGIPPENNYYPLETESFKQCMQVNRTIFQFTATLKSTSDIYVMSAYLPEPVQLPDVSNPNIQVIVGNTTYQNGIDFDVSINGRYISATFKNPFLNTKGQFRLRFPSNLKNHTKVQGCDVQLLGKGRGTAPRQIPDTCSPSQRPIDDKGFPMPWSGDARTVVNRKPKRTLTPEEINRGTSVYVTASTPNGQERHMSQLYYQTQAGTSFQKIGKETGWVINALAYNPQDNWLYGVSQGRVGRHTVPSRTNPNSYQYVPLEDPCFPAGHLLQIDPSTGEVYNLGKISDPNKLGEYGIKGDYNQPWPNDLWGGVNSGFIDKKGNFWVTNSSLSGSGHFYKINLDRHTAVLANSNANPNVKCPNTVSPYCSRAEDWTVLPESAGSKQNYAWGIKNGWAANKRIVAVRMDMNTGQVKEYDISDLRTLTGRQIPQGHQWGKAWTYGNGNLGFGTASSGATSHVLQLKVINPDTENPDFELISVDNTAPRSYNSNGTSNGMSGPFQVDLKAIKTFVREDQETGRLHWRVDIRNETKDISSSGFVVEDKFPQGHTDIKVEKTSGADVSINIGKDALQIVFGALGPGASASVEFSAARPASVEAGCAVNIVKVIGNEEDPNPQNNISEAKQCSEVPPLKIQIQKVDFDNQVKLLDATFTLQEAVGDTLETMVPGGEAKIITVNDQGISTQAEVQTGKYYFLVETKAPNGYSLLPQPILFRVDTQDNGQPHVTFPNQKENEGFPILKNKVKVAGGIITIPVADVMTGELPKTGGLGVGVIALLGLVIVACGLLTMCRSN